MKELGEYETLAAAQSDFYIDKRMMSGSQMKAYVSGLGMYLHFENHPAGLQRATFHEMKSPVGAFNFMQDHPAAVTGLIDAMIATASESEQFTTPTGQQISHKSAYQALKQLCLDYANKKVFPYVNATPRDFDRAKTKAPTPAHTVTYPNGENVAEIKYHVKSKNAPVDVTITLDNVSEFDETFDIYCHRFVDGEFIDAGLLVARVTIPAGKISAAEQINKRMTVKTQWSAICPYNVAYKMTVTEPEA